LYVAQFLTEELGGYHFIFASPSEGLLVLRNRPMDFVWLDAAVSSGQRAAIQACANEAGVRLVVVSRHIDRVDDCALVMPTSPSEVAALLRAHIEPPADGSAANQP
jgi:hypothetical protein